MLGHRDESDSHDMLSTSVQALSLNDWTLQPDPHVCCTMRPTVLCIWFFPQVFISLHTIETGAIRVNWVVKSYILPWNETLDYLVSIMILTRNRCAMYLVPTSKVLIAFFG